MQLTTNLTIVTSSVLKIIMQVDRIHGDPPHIPDKVGSLIADRTPVDHAQAHVRLIPCQVAKPTRPTAVNISQLIGISP